jgi:hypothetical protein
MVILYQLQSEKEPSLSGQGRLLVQQLVIH